MLNRGLYKGWVWTVAVYDAHLVQVAAQHVGGCEARDWIIDGTSGGRITDKMITAFITAAIDAETEVSLPSNVIKFPGHRRQHP